MTGRFLNTRVARRVLLTFLLGALVPLGMVAGLSYVAVTDQLEEQSRERLDQLAKTAGMGVVERLWYARGLLTEMTDLGLLADPTRPLSAVFRGAGLLRDGEWTQVRGEVGRLPERPTGSSDSGGIGLRIAADGSPPDIFVSVPGADEGEVVWGRVVADSLWSRAFASASLPTTSAICVLGSEGEALACGLDDGADLAEAVSGRASFDGVLEFSVGGDPHLVAAWEIYLSSSFDAAPWTLVVSESRDGVYAPMANFAATFPVALALGLAVIALMANVQIRRTLEPLDRLTEGTRRVGRGDLSTPVVVDSEDEFSELADSFNHMAVELEAQFLFLDVGRIIDQVSLTRFDREAVVSSLLEGCAQIVPGRRAAVLGLDGAEAWKTADDRASGATGVAVVDADGTVNVVPARELLPETAGVRIGPNDEGFATLSERGFDRTDGPVELFPLLIRGKVQGVLALGSRAGQALTGVERAKVRSLSARATLGIQGSELVHELELMASGTIRALARAIDAKSHWTAGHSERVAALSLALGRELALSEEEMGTLERGGLLHDVGKIGVPVSILDHPGALSDEQYEVMKRHPVIGVRILEPIEAFHPALPIVRSHHERWDGRGYPDGLRGRETHRLARVLAVADVFDAMVSTRPYRPAIPRDIVVETVYDGAGMAFDPEVVEAFMQVMDKGWDHERGLVEEVIRAS